MKREILDAVKRWYQYDWPAIENKHDVVPAEADRARDDVARPFLISPVAFFLAPWRLVTSRRFPFSRHPLQAFRAEVPYRSCWRSVTSDGESRRISASSLIKSAAHR